MPAHNGACGSWYHQADHLLGLRGHALMNEPIPGLTEAADTGRLLAARHIAYASELAGIAAAGLTETFTQEPPPLFTRWTLTWWIGTMPVTILAVVLMCLGMMWPGIAAATLAFASCAADARFGWWE